MKHIPELDGFRGFVVLMGFCYEMALPVGWISIQCFFILSSYLITSILLNAKDHNFKKYLVNFYARRSLRIWPVYFAMVLFLVVCVAFEVFPPKRIHDLSTFKDDLPYLLTFTYNIYFSLHQNWSYVYSLLWSLSAEEQFYFCWPFLVYFLSRRQLLTTLIFLIFVGPFIRMFWYGIYDYYLFDMFTPFNIKKGVEFTRGIFVYTSTSSHFDAFATGALLTLIPVETLKSWVKNKTLTFIVVGIFVIYGAAFGYFYSKSPWWKAFYPLQMRENYQFIFGYTVVNFFSALFMLNAMYGRLRSFFSLRPLRHLGTISLGYYIYHAPISVLIATWFNVKDYTDLTFGFAYFTVSFIFAHYSYVYFETYFLTLKKYFPSYTSTPKKS